MTINKGYRCHWCGEQSCSKEHLIELQKTGVAINRDYIDQLPQAQLKLFAKFINHQYAAWSALFELVTGQKPPKMKEVSAIISGHHIDK